MEVLNMTNEVIRPRILNLARALISLLILIPVHSNVTKGQEHQEYRQNQPDKLKPEVNPSNASNEGSPIAKTYIMEKTVEAKLGNRARIQPLPMSEMRDEWIKTLGKLP